MPRRRSKNRKRKVNASTPARSIRVYGEQSKHINAADMASAIMLMAHQLANETHGSDALFHDFASAPVPASKRDRRKK